jgi:hypothetical protein
MSQFNHCLFNKKELTFLSSTNLRAFFLLHTTGLPGIYSHISFSKEPNLKFFPPLFYPVKEQCRRLEERFVVLLVKVEQVIFVQISNNCMYVSINVCGKKSEGDPVVFKRRALHDRYKN